MGEILKELMREKCVVASHALPTGDLACNPGICPRLGTSDLLVCRLALNPLSHTSQGIYFFLKRSLKQYIYDNINCLQGRQLGVCRTTLGVRVFCLCLCLVLVSFFLILT